MSIAMAIFHSLAATYSIGAVNTIDETRRARLEILVTQFGSLAALNEKIGLARTDATLSQIRNRSAHSKTGAPRNMGDPLARRIEEALELDRGWMDTPITYAELYGSDDPRVKMMQLMERLPPDQWPTAVRLVDALGEPAKGNGTNG